MSWVLLINDPAYSQARTGFLVDGDLKDWSEGGPSEFDGRDDVLPVQIGGIDIRNYGHGLGVFHRDKEEFFRYQALLGELPVLNRYWKFTFVFGFMAPVFQDTIESSVELLFDVIPGGGQANPPWVEFFPEYRIELIGQKGGITKEIHRRWNGNQWIAKGAVDLPEVEAAVSGQWLEGAVPWFALDDPVSTGETFILKWAVRTTRGESHDYLPDGDWWDPWHAYDDHIITLVAPATWGEVRQQQKGKK